MTRVFASDQEYLQDKAWAGTEGKYTAILNALTAASARHTYMYVIKLSIVPCETNTGPQKYEKTSPNVLNATATPVASPRSFAGNHALAGTKLLLMRGTAPYH